MVAGILIPFTFFALVFGLLYVFWTNRNKERMALIEKGADPELFKSRTRNPISTKYWIFKIGMFLVGIGLGIVTGYWLFTLGIEEVTAYFSMILILGGLALITAFFIQQKMEKTSGKE